MPSPIPILDQGNLFKIQGLDRKKGLFLSLNPNGGSFRADLAASFLHYIIERYIAVFADITEEVLEPHIKALKALDLKKDRPISNFYTICNYLRRKNVVDVESLAILLTLKYAGRQVIPYAFVSESPEQQEKRRLMHWFLGGDTSTNEELRWAHGYKASIELGMVEKIKKHVPSVGPNIIIMGVKDGVATRLNMNIIEASPDGSGFRMKRSMNDLVERNIVVPVDPKVILEGIKKQPLFLSLDPKDEHYNKYLTSSLLSEIRVTNTVVFAEISAEGFNSHVNNCRGLKGLQRGFNAVVDNFDLIYQYLQSTSKSKEVAAEFLALLLTLEYYDIKIIPYVKQGQSCAEEIKKQLPEFKNKQIIVMAGADETVAKELGMEVIRCQLADDKSIDRGFFANSTVPETQLNKPTGDAEQKNDDDSEYNGNLMNSANLATSSQAQVNKPTGDAVNLNKFGIHSNKAVIEKDKGNIFYRNKQYEQALDSYNAAVKEDPACKEAWCNMAKTYYQLNNKAKALEAVKIARKIDETYGSAFVFYNKLEAENVVDNKGNLVSATIKP